MKKLLTTLFASLLVFIGLFYLAYVTSPFLLGKIFSHKTHTPVTIQKIDIKKGLISLSQLEIKNPKGTHRPIALKIEKISIQAPFSQYLHNPITIDQIHLDNVYVNIQIYNKEQTEGNWETLIYNMSTNGANPIAIERGAIVKKLILTNIQIDLILADGKTHELSPINRLEFDNIQSEQGISSEEISDIIAKKVMHSIFIENGLQNLLEAPINVIKKVLPFF